MIRHFFGEFIGTFCLVGIGCSSVALSLFVEDVGLYTVAGLWGLGVILGIYLSRSYSHAHLNPAVSLSSLLVGGLNFRSFLWYVLAQCLAAFSAAFVLFVFLDDFIVRFEFNNSIERGGGDSQLSAMIFGEYYPNPANSEPFPVSTGLAFLLELLGTFVLVAGILILPKLKKVPAAIRPWLIGFLVSTIIVFVAPYTQCGINPARDFGPRLFSALAGWKSVAFDLPNYGWLLVYILGPFLGAAVASFFYRFFVKS